MEKQTLNCTIISYNKINHFKNHIYNFKRQNITIHKYS